jgi:hypothetical protein
MPLATSDLPQSHSVHTVCSLPKAAIGKLPGLRPVKYVCSCNCFSQAFCLLQQMLGDRSCCVQTIHCFMMTAAMYR